MKEVKKRVPLLLALVLCLGTLPVSVQAIEGSMWFSTKVTSSTENSADSINFPIAPGTGKVGDNPQFSYDGISDFIAENGDLYAWGNKAYHPIVEPSGVGLDYGIYVHSEFQYIPVKILENVVSVNGCFAITGDNSLWGWGDLAHPPVKYMDDVVAVSGTIPVTFDDGRTGWDRDHVAMAIKTDGSLWGWGSNSGGRLGIGSVSSETVTTPIKIMDDVVAVTVTVWNTLALKSDGSLWIWGMNDYGRIGVVGTPEPSYDPLIANVYQTTPIKVMDDVAIMSSDGWSFYAIKNDGSLWSWGECNDFGLGDGTTADRFKPKKIMDHVVAVSPGYALTEKGTLYRWNGTDTLAPTKFMDHVLTFDSNSTGILVQKDDGTFWGWGASGSGQFGNEHGELVGPPRGEIISGLQKTTEIVPVFIEEAVAKVTADSIDTNTEESKTEESTNLTPAEEAIINKILALKAQYPEGMHWTDDNFYQSEALSTIGYGCAGFALLCSDTAFGDAPARNHSDFDQIKVGDVLRINNNTHSVVVLEKRADSVIVTEGNYDFSIHWGREISRVELEDGAISNWVMTRWGEVATPVQTPAEEGQTVKVDGKDDTPSSWAEAEVKAAIEKNLVPEDLQREYTTNITREEFCRLMVQLVEQQTGKSVFVYIASKGLTLTDPFSDTDNEDVLAAYALGIINGRGEGLFDPYSSITRQEAATMLTRAAKCLGLTAQNGLSFSDMTQASDWAWDSITFISGLEDPTSGNRVMSGTGPNMFEPWGTYTREQAILTTLRLFNAAE